MARAAALGALLVVAAAGTARATLLGLTVADTSSANYTLTSLSVTRSSAGTFTYTPGQLTGVDLTDVAAVQLPLAVQSGASLPAPGTRATLLEDNRLDTGVINPFSTGNVPEDSFEVTFRKPVVNSTGEDIVVLEIGSGDPTRFWVNNDRTNQGVDVTAAQFSGALLSGMAFTLYSYANGTDQNVNDLAELESATGFSFNKNDSGNVVGIGLDLSSFGVPLGASVGSLRFQSTSTTSRLDPVFIAGLPAVWTAGDANTDGVLTGDDYALIDRGYARYLSGFIPAGRATWSDGDFDKNGAVNAADYLLIDSAWLAAHPASPDFLAAREDQFGKEYVGSLLSLVPEPAIGLLLPLLFLRRRTRGRMRPAGHRSVTVVVTRISEIRYERPT